MPQKLHLYSVKEQTQGWRRNGFELGRKGKGATQDRAGRPIRSFDRVSEGLFSPQEHDSLGHMTE